MKTKRQVRCTICTTYRWMGNNRGRFKSRDEDAKRRMGREAMAGKRGQR